MAKTKSGRYGSGSFSDQFKQASKEKKLKKNKPDKFKKQKQIAKASKDGKITREEARELAKKGITLRDVENQNVKEFEAAQKRVSESNRNMKNLGRRTYDYDAPTFQPLKITKGADRAFGNYAGYTKAKPKASKETTTSSSTLSTPTSPTNEYQSQIENILSGIQNQQAALAQSTSDQYSNALASLQQTIASQQTNYQAELDAMQQQQEMQLQQDAIRQERERQQQQMADRAAQANMARSGLTPDVRLGTNAPRDTFGTDYFKRRDRQMASGTSTRLPGILSINI